MDFDNCWSFGSCYSTGAAKSSWCPWTYYLHYSLVPYYLHVLLDQCPELVVIGRYYSSHQRSPPIPVESASDQDPSFQSQFERVKSWLNCRLSLLLVLPLCATTLYSPPLLFCGNPMVLSVAMSGRSFLLKLCLHQTTPWFCLGFLCEAAPSYCD